MFEDNLLILLILGSVMAFLLPRLLFAPHQLLNKWLGWHYVLVSDLLSDRPCKTHRCWQEGDRLLVKHRGQLFELLQRGFVTEDANVSWMPLTWSPASRLPGDPRPRALAQGLSERRLVEKATTGIVDVEYDGG